MTFQFRTENLAVRSRLDFNKPNCIVTFDSYTDRRTLDRPGFGESFFEELGVDAVHVISRQNDWYQYPEIGEAAEVVRRLVDSRERVMTYGSSMGGYAAIRFGRMFGAHFAAAFSPQFSVDPRIVPFERRWIGDAVRIDYCLERDPHPFVARAFAFFDPTNLDKMHVDLFRPHTELIEMPVPLGGHPCTSILSDVGLLRPLLLRMLESGDPGDFAARFREARKNSPTFYFNLSMAAKRPRAKARLAEKMFWLRSDAMHGSHYGLMLGLDGRFDEGRLFMLNAIEQEPNNLVILYRYSEFLEEQGDLVGALDLMDRIFALTNDARGFRPRREHLAKGMASRWASLFHDQFAKESPEPPIMQPEPKTQSLSLWALALARRAALFLGRRPPRPPVEPEKEEDLIAARRLEAEILLTATPSPPQFVGSWRRHLTQMEQIPQGPFDLVLIGDSLAEWWPEELFGDRRIFNLGVAGDRTQHLLWRIQQMRDAGLEAKAVLCLIGTNNLGSGDSAEAISAGIARVADALARKIASATTLMIEIPPIGTDFSFRSAERRRANELIRGLGPRTLNVDAALMAGGQPSPYFKPDGVHFSEAGYALLTGLVEEVLAKSNSPDPEPVASDADAFAGYSSSMRCAQAELQSRS